MAENDTDASSSTHRAGLFDIRFIIAALLGVYGVILVVTGFFTSDNQLDKADGLNVNLAGGFGMVVVALAFGIWARVRPIVVPDHVEKEDGPA